jgi:iron complex outermembrane receptor protein
MNMKQKVRFCAGASWAAMMAFGMGSSPAWAQQATANQPSTQPADQSAGTATQTPDQTSTKAPGNETNPEPEIIVTAQKREQSLSKVSLSVAAVSGATLANTQTNNIEQLQKLVPSVSFGNDFNFAKLFIRGIGLSSSLPGVDPSVALHVDGAVVSLAQAQLGSLFDLERVEVLRGPQGTLYGRNATGGAVNLITAKPTAKLNGYARLTVGNYDNVIAEAAVGGPIANGIRARVAVQRVKRGGYGKNEFTGHDIDNANQWSARAHLELLPTDKLDVLLTGEIHTEDDRSLAIKFRERSFPTFLPPNPLSSVGDRDGASFAKKVRDLNTNFDPINDRKQWALTGTGRYDLTDQLNIKSITSYRKFRAIFFHDFDMSSYLGYPIAQTTSFRTSANHWQPVWQHQFSEELQFNFDTERLHGIVGAFYLKEHIRIENHIGYDVLTNTDPFRVQFDGKLDVSTWAGFANATYDLTDQFSLKAGARYSWEKRHIKNNSGIGSAPQCATGACFRLDPLQWDQSKTWKNFSPTLGFEYRPTRALMLYGNWAKGFKSGTAEIGSRRSATATTPFVDPETVNAFEVGAKGRWGTLQANLALFHHKLKNGQFQRTFPIPAPPFFASQLENAAESKANGAELELLWQPVRGLRVDGAIAYLDSKFTKFFSKNPLNPLLFGPGGASLPDEDLSGNRTRMSPKWSINFNPSYKARLAGGSSLTFATNVAYKSKQYHTEFNDDRLAQDAYTLIDANILYGSPGNRYTVNLWAKNLTNKLVWAGSYAVATSRTIGGTLMPPRTYGVTAGFNF